MEYNDDNYWEFQGRCAPMCPHCGEVEQDWWDGLCDLEDFSPQEVTCGSCCKDYILELSLRFDTSPSEA